MGKLLASEIGRLVYGYLESNGCSEAADSFLRFSSSLGECREAKETDGGFSTEINGLSLENVMQEHAQFNNLITHFAKNITDPNHGISHKEAVLKYIMSRSCSSIPQTPKNTTNGSAVNKSGREDCKIVKNTSSIDHDIEMNPVVPLVDVKKTATFSKTPSVCNIKSKDPHYLNYEKQHPILQKDTCIETDHSGEDSSALMECRIDDSGKHSIFRPSKKQDIATQTQVVDHSHTEKFQEIVPNVDVVHPATLVQKNSLLDKTLITTEVQQVVNMNVPVENNVIKGKEIEKFKIDDLSTTQPIAKTTPNETSVVNIISNISNNADILLTNPQINFPRTGEIQLATANDPDTQVTLYANQSINNATNVTNVMFTSLGNIIPCTIIPCNQAILSPVILQPNPSATVFVNPLIAKKTNIVTPSKNTNIITPTKNTNTFTPIKNTNIFTPIKNTNTVTPTKNTNTVTPTKNTNIVTPTKNTNTVTPTKNTNTVTPSKKINPISPGKKSGTNNVLLKTIHKLPDLIPIKPREPGRNTAASKILRTPDIEKVLHTSNTEVVEQNATSIETSVIIVRNVTKLPLDTKKSDTSVSTPETTMDEPHELGIKDGSKQTCQTEVMPKYANVQSNQIIMQNQSSTTDTNQNGSSTLTVANPSNLVGINASGNVHQTLKRGNETRKSGNCKNSNSDLYDAISGLLKRGVLKERVEDMIHRRIHSTLQSAIVKCNNNCDGNSKVEGIVEKALEVIKNDKTVEDMVNFLVSSEEEWTSTSSSSSGDETDENRKRWLKSERESRRNAKRRLRALVTEHLELEDSSDSSYLNGELSNGAVVGPLDRYRSATTSQRLRTSDDVEKDHNYSALGNNRDKTNPYFLRNSNENVPGTDIKTWDSVIRGYVKDYIESQRDTKNRHGIRKKRKHRKRVRDGVVTRSLAKKLKESNDNKINDEKRRSLVTGF